MSDYIMVYKVDDGQDSVVYLEHEDNVITLLRGFIDYAEPNQKMALETVLVTREELQNLPRGI